MKEKLTPIMFLRLEAYNFLGEFPDLRLLLDNNGLQSLIEKITNVTSTSRPDPEEISSALVEIKKLYNALKKSSDKKKYIWIANELDDFNPPSRKYPANKENDGYTFFAILLKLVNKNLKESLCMAEVMTRILGNEYLTHS